MSDLIERLRLWSLDLTAEAADALEQQAGEIERLKAEVADITRASKEGWRYAAELEDERKRLTAEVGALRKDAERYRWLRKGGNLWGICVWEDDEWAQDARTNVDSLIDAAMEGKK